MPDDPDYHYNSSALWIFLVVDLDLVWLAGSDSGILGFFKKTSPKSSTQSVEGSVDARNVSKAQGSYTPSASNSARSAAPPNLKCPSQRDELVWKKETKVKLDSDGQLVYDALGAWKPEWEKEPAFKGRLRVSGGIAWCLYCRATGQHNSFNTGIPVTEQWDRTQLRQH
jgi:hypothetical protein